MKKLFIALLTFSLCHAKVDTTPKTINYLVDTDDNGIYDFFYNSTSALTTNTEINDDGNYLIDSDADGIWDYIYDPVAGTLTSLNEESGLEGETQEFPLIQIGGIIIVITILFFIVVFFKKSRRLSNVTKQNKKNK